jgi:hypothetical protein
MKNKSKNNSNVLSINSSNSDYQSALELFRNYPTMPTYCRLLDKALAANIQIATIEPELKLLIGISNQQFFCFKGSEYLRKNSGLLRDSNLNYPDSTSSIETSEILWKIFKPYESDDLYGFENYLVGDSDYSYLVSITEDLTETSTVPTVYERPSELAQFAYEAAKAIGEMEKSSRTIQEEAEKLGFKMIPWSVWAADVLEHRPELRAGLIDFSDYLSSYFVDDENLQESSNQLNKKQIKINQENSKSLLKILSFLLFYPLIKDLSNKGKDIEFDDFWIERLVNYSSIDSYSELNGKAEYILAISNYLLMCGKFGVNSVESELVTVDELKRKFLADCNAEYLDTACLALLPAEGFSQMVAAINPFEGDREDDYFLDDVLRVSDYGVTGVPNKRHLEKIYINGFEGMNVDLIDILKARTEKKIKKWMIPLTDVGSLHHIYKDFWNDEVILEKISASLSHADKEPNVSCQFSLNDINDITLHPDIYDQDHHPAMFARRFANKADFMRVEDEEWLAFAKSLNSVGQKRFLCVLMALFFTRTGYQSYYNVNDIKFDIPGWIKLLQITQPLNSFGMVQQSISDMFELVKDIPVIFKGSLQEYLPSLKSEKLPLKSKDGDRYLIYRKDLVSSGLLLDKLNMESQESLVKGYTLTRDKELAVFNLNSAALQNYFFAVEGELRSRIVPLDNQLIEELQHFSVEIDFVRDLNTKSRIGKIRGLYGIILLIENFTKLSESSRRKLIKIAPLAVHKECSHFINSLNRFREIRNSVQHADQSIFASQDLLELVNRTEGLILGEGQIIDILCNTKK